MTGYMRGILTSHLLNLTVVYGDLPFLCSEHQDLAAFLWALERERDLLPTLTES